MRIIATLASHVVHVVLVGSEEQVFRIAAGRYVAAVTDFHSLRDWTLEVMIGEFVRSPDPLIRSSKLPVSPLTSKRSGPNPTAF